MDRNVRSLVKSVALGVGCGIAGVLLTVFSIYVPETDTFIDLRELPAVILAFFVGALPAAVAGVVAAAGRLLLPALGLAGGALAVPAATGTLCAVAGAIVVRRWVLFGQRPCFMDAALYAALMQMMNCIGIFVTGWSDLGASLAAVSMMIAFQCAGNALGAAVASFAFRAAQPLRANLRALWCAAAIIGIGFAVWSLQDRMALVRARETVSAQIGDVMTGVDYPTEAEMLRQANQLTLKWKSASAAAGEDLAAIARGLGYDFLAVVGKDGKVLCASDPKAVGSDFGADEQLKEFLSILTCDQRHYIQQFREPSFPAPGAEDRKDCKHVGLGFRDGSGFVFIANTFGAIAERDYLLGDAVLDWHIGEGGSFLLVDPATGKVISGIENDRIGKTLAEMGLDSVGHVSPDAYFGYAEVLGVPSLVRREPIGFAPIDIYAIMPYSEVTCQRDLATVLTVVVVSVVFLFGSMAFATIIRQGRDIAVLRAQEDERRRKDMDLAKSIQTSSLVTDFPAGVHALMRTAREVGGDFYDAFMTAPGKLMVVVADVSGKGIPASLFMMRARTELRAVSRETDDVAAIMTEVNSRLCQNNVAEMFVTAWVGVIDLETLEVVWSSAGHNPPFVLRSDGRVEAVAGRPSLVLAGMDGVRYASHVLKLEPGDRLFLYTDGVTEAQSSAGAFYGEDRLKSVLGGARGSSRDVCETVVASVDAFAAGAPQADDITVLAVSL